MKFVAVLAVALSLVAVVSHSAAAPSAAGYGAAAASAAGAPAPVSIPAPACPKNYLFSCQPRLQPAPCSSSGGSAGAYSQNYPVYAVPPQYIEGYPAY